jgi:hypothetical protein
MVKNYRKPLWIDHDDNLFDVGLDNPVFQDYANSSVKESIAEMLGLADVVTVSTPHLGEVYGRFAKKMVVIPNALDDDVLDVDKPLGETKPIVFWRGSNTHAKDWASVGPGYVEAAAKHPEWKYGFMGYQPWHIIEPLSKLIKPDGIMNFGGCDVMRYFDVLKQVAPKVMVVPLFAGPFNLCKSNIAWLEATYAGAVTIAPNWAEWNRPGVVMYDAKNPVEDFAAKLDLVLSMSEEERVKLRHQSWSHVKGHLVLSRVNQQRKMVLETYMRL